MNVVGYVFLGLIALALSSPCWSSPARFPDIRRYVRMRRM